MEILIGRDEKSGRMKLTAEGRSILYGTERLPDSVLAEHVKLTIENGTIRLKNLNINAYTYVNGQAVESKTISKQHQIELGGGRIPFDWRALDEFIPVEVDIRPLQTIWNTYEHENIALQIAERKFNTLRSTTGIITMVAIALSIAFGGKNLWYLLLYAVAIVVSVAFFVKAYRDSTKIPQKRQELYRAFQHDYVCPHCGHFMGNQSYELLTQNSRCPYCKAKFIH
mgnify:FL=1